MPNPFVRKLSAYGPLTDEDIALLVAASHPTRSVARSRDLIAEGDEPGPLFIVLEGWACRYKVLPDGSRQIMAFLMPGDFCDVHVGELDEMDHSIGTITDCRVKALGRGQVEALIVASPTLTRAFWRAQLIDEGVLRAWIVSLGRRSSTERIAHLMLELYVRMRNVGLATSLTCDLPLTQGVLADALGLTPVHLNRVVRKLRAQGIMQLTTKTLTILDAAKLTRLAGFDENYLHRRTQRAQHILTTEHVTAPEGGSPMPGHFASRPDIFTSERSRT